MKTILITLVIFFVSASLVSADDFLSVPPSCVSVSKTILYRNYLEVDCVDSSNNVFRYQSETFFPGPIVPYFVLVPDPSFTDTVRWYR